MFFSTITWVLFVCGLGAFAVPTSNESAPIVPSKPGLEYTGPLSTPQLKLAFTAKIDWDLNNVFGFWLAHSVRGYWYDTKGQQIGEILRANDDGIVPPGTNYLELATPRLIFHDLTFRFSRVQTASPKYDWLNMIDFVAPGTFNGTEIMTVQHYYPNVSRHE
ncbi:hypothetical protein N0V95_003191 [Ascochyta clinopodiicola]|nr:hypothetical protein N0V95_003191 [Ascochyta clinopodiicola]